MKKDGRKINKKYGFSAIAAVCIYILCLKLGIISPQELQGGDADSAWEESYTWEEGSAWEESSAWEENSAAAQDRVSEEYVENTYAFRSQKLLESHFEKHGMEMGFATAEEYAAAANRVIANPGSLHKLEKEDDDHVYFLEETNEFVILSQDGYIRTYYIADGGRDYFERQ